MSSDAFILLFHPNFKSQHNRSYMVTGKHHKNSLLLITEKSDWPTKCTRHKLFVSVFSTTFVQVFLWNRYLATSAGNASRDIEFAMYTVRYFYPTRNKLQLFRHITVQVHNMRSILNIHLAVLDFAPCSQTEWERNTYNFLTIRQKKCNPLSSVLEIINKSLYAHRDVIYVKQVSALTTL